VDVTPVLPNVVIIGAQKAGTTFLKLCLRDHPDVDAPRGETPFFEDPHYGSGDPAALARLFQGSRAPARVIKRPDYLADPAVPERIHAAIPDARLIAVLRDPVERAISAYLHFTARGLLPLVGVDRGMRRILDGRYDGRYPAARDVLEYGFYGRHLQRYAAVFPEEQMLVLTYDELRRRPEDTVAQVFGFVGVDDAFAPPALGASANPTVHALPRMAAYRVRTRLVADIDRRRAKVHRRPRVPTINRWVTTAVMGFDARVLARVEGGRRPEPAGDVRDRLRRLYREDTEALARGLGLDLSSWTI
jgi:hypothetical protein